jgi:hypothetical protein
MTTTFRVVGEQQDLLVRGIEQRQCAFEVEDADLARVGFTLAAFFSIRKTPCDNNRGMKPFSFSLEIPETI